MCVCARAARAPGCLRAMLGLQRASAAATHAGRHLRRKHGRGGGGRPGEEAREPGAGWGRRSRERQRWGGGRAGGCCGLRPPAKDSPQRKAGSSICWRKRQAGAWKAAEEAGGLDRAQVALLLPDDRPRPHDAKPPHRLPRSEAVRPHQVQRDERPRPAEPREAVYGDGAGGGVDDAEECGDDVVGRGGAVLENEVEVLEAVRGEAAGVVARLVEAHDGADPHVMEDVGVIERAEEALSTRRVVVFASAEVHRALKGDELARDHLLQVAISRIVVVSILVDMSFAPHDVGMRKLNPALKLSFIESSPTVK